MPASLVELSDTKSTTSEHPIVVDYGRGTPWLCRSGLWFGVQTEFIESVVLSYEHDPEDIYVGWALNGTVVSNPGFPPSYSPWIPGIPVPGAPDVLYLTPADGFYHRISLSGKAGMDKTCVYAQVLYTTYNDIAHGKPMKYGPAMTVCLSGAEILWPQEKLDAERRCLQHLWEIIHKYVLSKHVNPGDPVERWLARVHGDDAVRLKGVAEALEQMDAAANPKLVEAARAELSAVFERLRMQGRIADLGARATKAK